MRVTRMMVTSVLVDDVANIDDRDVDVRLMA